MMRMAAQRLGRLTRLLRDGTASIALLAGLGCGWPLAAQGPGGYAAGAAQSKAQNSQPASAHARRRVSKKNAAPAPVVEAQAVVQAAPAAPNWPVNSKAEHAQVNWDGRQLRIAATNSSLQQILRDVSAATGLKVEGLNTVQGAAAEQRIYGSYGPAAAREVLSSLLDGSGYNVLMIGDQGEGTPRELVLTSKRGGATPKTVAAQPQADGTTEDMAGGEEDAPEDPEPPEQQEQPVMQRPFGIPPQPPGAQNPQQMLQEIQQRQLLMQQQLQNQVNEQPQPQPE